MKRFPRLTPVAFRLAATIAVLFLVSVSLGANASEEPAVDSSNKWRLEFSGKANSDGVIAFLISPLDGDPISVEVSVENNTGENGVAKTVVKGLKAHLPKDRFHVERDDGEDVLIKKRHGTEDFGVEIVSNDVDGVRIKKEKE